MNSDSRHEPNRATGGAAFADERERPFGLVEGSRGDDGVLDADLRGAREHGVDVWWVAFLTTIDALKHRIEEIYADIDKAWTHQWGF